MRTIAIAALLCALTAAAQTTYFQDPLTSGSVAGRGVQGGSFGADGWTTTAGNDTIWYQINDALESGRFEYTVTGLQLGTTLNGGDTDIFSMYQAPDGLSEPLQYQPGFRNNDFKTFTRINGSLDPSRPGSMKLEMTECVQGSPWYHGSCPAGCGQDLIAYAFGSTNDVGWDPAASYRMAIAWGNGVMSFERDGVVLGTVNYAGTYAPQPLMIRIGSPRNENIDPTVHMPIGVVFKDVVITGTAGTQTAICGAPPPPPDGGNPLPAQTLGVIQDVTGADFAGTGVFSDVTDLNVEADANNNPDAIVYLRFPPLPGPVLQATLTMHTRTESSAAGGSGQPCAVMDATWSETTLTWPNRPAFGTCVGAASSVTPDVEVSWDVTSLVQAGAAGFAIVSHDGNGAHFMSKEGATADHAARLSYVLDPNPPDAGSGGGGGAGGGAAGGGSASGGGAGGGAGGGGEPPDSGTTGTGGGAAGGGPPVVTTPGSMHSHLTGGCGCDATSAGSMMLLALVLLVLRSLRPVGARR